jgi:hypothetical protein
MLRLRIERFRRDTAQLEDILASYGRHQERERELGIQLRRVLAIQWQRRIIETYIITHLQVGVNHHKVLI